MRHMFNVHAAIYGGNVSYQVLGMSIAGVDVPCEDATQLDCGTSRGSASAGKELHRRCTASPSSCVTPRTGVERVRHLNLGSEVSPLRMDSGDCS